MAMLLKQLEDKYEILETVQADETGAAYRVRHRLLGEVRLIRAMRPRPGKRPESRDRVLAEARAALRLELRHEPRIYDCSVDDDGVAYVVMEIGPDETAAEPVRPTAEDEVETVFLRPAPDAAIETEATGNSGDEDTRVRPRPAGRDTSGREETELEETVVLIRQLRDDGRAGEALKVLTRAVSELGPRPELKTLRYELGEALLERDAEEEDSASRMFEATAPAQPEPPPAVFDPTIRSASAILPPTPERPGPPVAHSNRSLVVVGLILAAVFALLVYVLVGRQSGRRAAIDSQDVEAAGLTPGSVAVDARPWAEIVGLEKPGAAEEPLVPPSRFTPLVFRLPPGEYRITLRYPPTGQVEQRVFRVDSDARVDERVTFESFDGQRYFESIGW